MPKTRRDMEILLASRGGARGRPNQWNSARRSPWGPSSAPFTRQCGIVARFVSRRAKKRRAPGRSGDGDAGMYFADRSSGGEDGGAIRHDLEIVRSDQGFSLLA